MTQQSLFHESKEQRPFVKGELSRMIFHNESEHFSIASIKVKETNEDFNEKTLVIKGHFSPLEEGETYIFHGEFKNHKKFGRQYEVEMYNRVLPETKDGLVLYLSSDLFHGIGKKTAERIVNELGEQSITKILEDRHVLDAVPKLPKEKADQLYNSLKEHQGFEHVMIHLSQYGFGLKLSQKIYEAFQDQTMAIIEEDPYQLVFHVEGFGFHRADEMARFQNLAHDHPTRIRAACLYMMQKSMNSGHVYLPTEECLIQVEQLLNQGIEQAITYKELSEQLIHLGEERLVYIEEDRIYLPSLYFAENGFCNHVDRIQEKNVEVEHTQADLMKIIGDLEEEEAMSYGEDQFNAIEKALHSKLMILTGGPGTGKTTVIKGIIHSYAELNDVSIDPEEYDSDKPFPFVLAAPTGRAAKRMTESTGLPASTIHRLLGWDGHDSFERNQNNPLEGNVLIVDEFSMVDIWLANQLFRAIPDGMQVLLVGDEDQLPSVGPGQVLADLLASGKLPSIKLTEVYRQKEGSKIIQLAHEIKNDACTMASLGKDHDFSFIPAKEHQLSDLVTNIVQKAKEKGNELKDIQVLAPMYRTDVGIHKLNESIQQVLNPKSKQKRDLKHFEVTYRKGDKVIQLVNQPEDGVYNGDIGEIVAIFRAEENIDGVEQVVVDFEGKEVVYPKKDLNNIMHAYCTSIHKSQGSEFSIVILPVVRSYRRMLRKNLLYTAITRSKQSLIICGDREAFLSGVGTTDTDTRYTRLKEKLNEEPSKEIEPEEEEQLSPYDFM
ncbi:ATP-dependent DNA helicase, RecD/TraA family [Halobacillus karajensis]|uniref:ATP-dependent RecD2 DNA helicase n=1 Tax=Halobacillus karajensis TaxID=195088 RepID=A0A024P5U9_9BACI|nr:ATP-dependent RecD-like DNA helicase [Halobacillus karajensis]CDQ18093.1 Exodeoxyribonuclease V alpha chain [Halobacillus karajensis]CDQ24444.1 Exodeoxyribonuclease V alpha chain [Halobacillus karajensis]CDQ29308.1 Exodeoxyribonuclease V alpha chain [Halobacillus karajensis]SEH59432.1 ATP-dependent DNA helicase, RecD/TraA family [Halobacillus karajensis]